MDAKHIARLICAVADLAHEGTITLEMNTDLNASLWELASLKDVREDVDSILQEDAKNSF